jgi:uncharacterized protein YutE (UPF0331/DUF86 family)
MLDKERILGKIDDLDSYLDELQQVVPVNFEEYQKIEKKRSCERLLQLCIECAVDVCKLFVSGLKLGLPSEENDLFTKMQKKKIISKKMGSLLKEMRAFRNILIHEYASVDDELIYEKAQTRLADFKTFKKEVLTALKNL